MPTSPANACHHTLGLVHRDKETSSCCMIFLILPVGKHVSPLRFGIALRFFRTLNLKLSLKLNSKAV